MRRVDYKQKPLKIDRQAVEQAIQGMAGEREFWEGRAAHCGQALALMREARPKAWPGSRQELDYVIYKTENFITVFELLSAVQEAKADFDRVLLAISAEEPADKIGKELEQAERALQRADQLVHQAAEQMIPYARLYPTERHILWIFNKVIPSYDAAERYLDEVIAFCKK